MRYRQLFTISLFLIHSCTAQPPAENYTDLLQEMTAARSRFSNAYTTADSLHKDSVVTEAKKYLLNKITSEIFPQWYGTPWDFYGTTRMPKQGKIACGYFVTTVLEDAGFNIPRVAWAQSASEVFIKKLSVVKRFSGKSAEEMKSYLLKQGNGLYLAGLDNHVGFVWVNGRAVKFIHSSYYWPETGVMSEDINTNNPFNNSRYRAIGKLLSDEMIVRWMTNFCYKYVSLQINDEQKNAYDYLPWQE